MTGNRRLVGTGRVWSAAAAAPNEGLWTRQSSIVSRQSSVVSRQPSLTEIGMLDARGRKRPLLGAPLCRTRRYIATVAQFIHILTQDKQCRRWSDVYIKASRESDVNTEESPVAV